MKAIKFVLIISLALISSGDLLAQYRYDYFRVGISGGATNYLGDLDDDLTFKFTKPGVGIQGSYRFNPLMNIRLGYFQGWMGASDAQNTSADRRRRNLSFRSPISEFSAQLVIDFLPSERRYLFRPTVVPYIFGGLAIFSFNPQTQLNGQWIDLQPIGTEGQWLPSQTERGYPEPYELTQVSIPMGVGLRFKVARRWDLEVEAGWRKTFTDYLDDVSGYYIEESDIASSSNPNLLRNLYDRIDLDQFPGGATVWNGIRGDNTQRDWYIYSSISINYILDWVQCPTFR